MFGQNNQRQPREGDIARVLERNQYGDPVVWEDPFGNIFGIDNFGKVVLLQPAPMQRRPEPTFQQYQQPSFRQPQPQQFGFSQGFPTGNMNSGMAGFSSQGFNRGKRAGFMTESSKVDQLQPQQQNQPTQPIQSMDSMLQSQPTSERVYVGYRPEPGSEFIPIYDPEIEKLDVVFDHDRKTYKFIVIKK